MNAVMVRSDAAAALCDAANALRAAGRLAAATEAFTRAVALEPDNAALWNDLGSTLMESTRYDEACRAFTEAVRIDPALFVAWSNAATCHHIRGRGVEALRCYREATRRDPQFLYARVQGLTVARETCDWRGWHEDVAGLLAARPLPSNTAPQMNLLYLPLGPRALREHAECFAAQWRLPSLHRPRARHPRGPRIRLGILSDDVRDHVVGWLVVGVLEALDRTRFELHLFDWRGDDGSIVRRRLRRAGCVIHDIASSSDEAAAHAIVAAGIDVLVDLKGYTGGHRMGILARRPAPVQVAWLGYAGTTGAPFIDYVLGDPQVTPEGDEAQFTERVLRLPHCFMPTDRQRPVSDHGNRELYGLPAESTVLCYLGQSRKITPEVLDDWVAIVNAIDGAVLWIRADNDAARHNLRREARARGLAPERLVLVPEMSLRASDYLARYRLADLALDTFPYGSHTTACDALWGGCPLVTLAGETFASRVAASLLHAAGLPDLVARSREQFRALAIGIGRDAERRAALRERVRLARDGSPLFDTRRFTRELESALESALDRWLQADDRGGDPAVRA